MIKIILIPGYVIPQGSLLLSVQLSQATTKILFRHSGSAEADRMTKIEIFLGAFARN
jgi:hypothetical protein